MPVLVSSVFFDHATIDAWIAEDAGYLDLTVHLLGLGAQPACIAFTLRGAGVAACTEEAARVLQHCGAQLLRLRPSGTSVPAGGELLAASGPAASVLRAWKVVQNLLETACGIASATAAMVAAVQATAPGVALLTTRKSAPGLRRIALKATLCGGAHPHRLGVGETVLVFAQHRALLGDAPSGHWPALAQRLARMAPALAEKLCVIEVTSLEEAWLAAQAGAQVLQFDKVAPPQLRAWGPQLRARYPQLRLLAAGGIHLGNVADYAASGVDALVSSSPHHAPPADVAVQVLPLQ